MQLCFNTDGLGGYPRDEMLDIIAANGYEAAEFACGNWSQAPHIDLDCLLDDKKARSAFTDSLEKRNITIAALNCSGNQLAPNDEGRAHQAVVEKTFRLAEMLGVTTIVMMSGCPGGAPDDTTPNWICASWPPITTQILEWQWNEVLIPYWHKTVELAKRHGIQKIALENHGCQMVYSAETLFRLRDAVGDHIGLNFDPSHLMWMGGDPIRAIRTLGKAIYYVHAKDVRLERGACDVNGVLDTKTIDRFADRAWNFVALGHGHDVMWWKEFFSVLSMCGYDGTVSLEMEDLTMDPLAVLQKSTQVLKEALPRAF
ncbi:MAG: sugar phosphate isomerase/epimerase [Planctomycetaceae bacterium]|nr:sugar phosphate isomerase/epimerase [Planctomycetaceae bacterium]